METESKFIIPSEAAFARLRAIDMFGKYERRDEHTKEVHDRYLDTPDQAFLKRGWCFRLRKSATGDLLITLKSLQRHAVGTETTSTAIQARDEYETSVTGLKMSKLARQRSQELAKEIAGKQPMRDLITVDQVRTVSYLYEGERAVAELSIDNVDFHTASPSEPGEACSQDLRVGGRATTRRHPRRSPCSGADLQRRIRPRPTAEVQVRTSFADCRRSYWRRTRRGRPPCKTNPQAHQSKTAHAQTGRSPGDRDACWRRGS